MSQQPVLTIFCAFSRYWEVKRWIEQFLALGLDPKLTNLCFIIDCDEPRIASQLQKMEYDHHFRSFRYIMNTDWHPNEVRIAVRRQRIVDVMNQAKTLISKTDGLYLICLEDDTDFGKLDARRLYEPLTDWYKNRVAFVEGVQCGRWGAKMIGAWNFDSYHNPTEAHTLLPSEAGGYERIDAGGFYGFATLQRLFLEYTHHWKPEQPWGPDVNYGLWLRKLGWHVLIDWDTVFGHNDHNFTHWPTSDLVSVCYTKDNSNNSWERQNDKTS